MPCSKYKGKQRKACYASEEWTKPLDKKKTDMGQHNIEMIIIYIETQLDRDLTLEESSKIENDLLHNFDEFEYPTEEIANLMIEKHILDNRVDGFFYGDIEEAWVKDKEAEGIPFEEALDLVEKKQAEGYESDLYDDGFFDAIAHIVNIAEELKNYPGTIDDYLSFIQYLENNFEIKEEEIEARPDLYQQGFYDVRGIMKSLMEYFDMETVGAFIDFSNEVKQNNITRLLKIRQKNSTGGAPNRIIEREKIKSDSRDILANAFKKLCDGVMSTAEVETFFGRSPHGFSSIYEVEAFFNDLIEKDGRVPTDHQYWRLMNLAKVMTGIPEATLIRHYEAIMEDKPIADKKKSNSPYPDVKLGEEEEYEYEPDKGPDKPVQNSQDSSFEEEEELRQNR